MRYQPTIHLDFEMLEQLRTGELQLQCGQWILLPKARHLSRWVGLTQGGSLWAAHFPYGRQGNAQFQSMCRNIMRKEEKDICKTTLFLKTLKEICLINSDVSWDYEAPQEEFEMMYNMIEEFLSNKKGGE